MALEAKEVLNLGKSKVNSEKFLNYVASINEKNTFNPYSQVCSVFDIEGADKIRKKIMHNLLEKAEIEGVDSIWIGRDLGYRGGRRTGLALTDEVNMAQHANRWGVNFSPVTSGPPVAERTAAVIWSVLETIIEDIFLWNVFPLHPHEPDEPFTNRSHNAIERRLGEEILEQLIHVLRPKKLIAIGNDAAASASKIAGNMEIIKIRHPSYGGQNIFLSQVKSIYGVEPHEKQKKLF